MQHNEKCDMIDRHAIRETDMARRRPSRPSPEWMRKRSQELLREARELEQRAEAAEREEPAKPPKPEPVEVELVRSTYQPSKAEREEDLRVDASFEEALDALVMPVKIKRVQRPPQ